MFFTYNFFESYMKKTYNFCKFRAPNETEIPTYNFSQTYMKKKQITFEKNNPALNHIWNAFFFLLDLSISDLKSASALDSSVFLALNG